MAYWLGVSPGQALPEDSRAEARFEGARLTQAIRAADPVALITLAPTARLVAVAEVGGFSSGAAEGGPASVWVRVTRQIDPPVEVSLPEDRPGFYAISPARFVELAGSNAPKAEAGAAEVSSRLPPEWMVSVSLPIEAETRGDAVRAFWAYVQSLGPGELPAFVWPRGDELALQAYVLEDPANLDPEED
jgi:hypothetical protein